jgi:hypothetical protein
MQLYISPHDAAIREERARRCPTCHGSGVKFDFLVSGMRVVGPCDCPLGEHETTICEIGNPRACPEANPSRHRRTSNIVGRPKSPEAYWSRVRRPADVLAELEC